jgi:hypothetical protein
MNLLQEKQLLKNKIISMKKNLLMLAVLFFGGFVKAQNVGIGIPNPTERLEVLGNLKVSNNVNTYNILLRGIGGSTSDFWVKTSDNYVTTRKGHGAVAVSFIIATEGINPLGFTGTSYTQQILGEIRMFASPFVPNGWALCNGQLLQINQNQSLFSLIGATYGGNGQFNFALPDLRGAAPVHYGTTANGTYSWLHGQKSQ